MATPPVFSAGAVLTAAQMNAVGLWLVSVTTIPAQASLTISGLSSDFDAYHINIKAKATGQGGYSLAMGNSTSNTTGWYGSELYYSYTGAPDGVIRTNNAGVAEIGLSENGAWTFSTFDLINPNVAEYTMLAGNYIGRERYTGNFSYFLANTTSYTSFTISSSVGDLSSGKIYVYGYRNG